MNISFNFLIQATRVLDFEDYDNQNLKMISYFVLSLENDTLFDYYNTQTLVGYGNDLELYNEILDSLIKIHELKEEYEMCQKLLIQKRKTINILKTK